MKKLLLMKVSGKTLISFILFVFVLSACRKSTTLPDGTVSVKYKRCSPKISDTFICFDSLITDSRCPEGAICFWQGDAVITVTFHESGNQHSFRMSLTTIGANYNAVTDTIINSYKIRFTDLKPYPKITFPPVKEPLIAVFEITR